MGDIRSLGYIRVQIADLEAWRKFAFDVIGFAEGSGPDPNALYFRMDERCARIVLLPGSEDRVEAIGWEVRDYLALQRVQAAVESAGIPVKPLTVDEADARLVEGGVSLEAPGGAPLEVFYGPVLDHSPVITPYGAKFVTGPLGLGHSVIASADVDASYKFFAEVLGFLPRGGFRFPMPTEAGPVRMRFMGVNPRHHSLAVVPGAPGTPVLNHVMVEVEALDDVGRALDRVMAAGHHLTSTLGRHTNDKMVSFYVRTPGGWDIEVGTEGLEVDEDYYTAEEITADAYWGHKYDMG